VPDDALPERPGWYPDPYDSSRQRWFDGSRWTLHAVDELSDPDAMVQSNWSMSSPEELRRQEWEEQFPPWDAVTNRTSEYRWDRGRRWMESVRPARRSPWLIALQAVLVTLGSVGLVLHAVTASGDQQAWAVGALLLAVGAGFVVAKNYLRRRRTPPVIHVPRSRNGP
jgi:hypothetical protein